jgi:hypothetical protein
MNDVFMSCGQYGELDMLKEDGSICQIWQVSGTGLTNSVQSRDGYENLRTTGVARCLLDK